MEKEEFRKLVEHVSDGTASDAEIALYNRYYHEFQQAGESWDPESMGEETAIKQKLKLRIDKKIKLAVIVPLWKKYIPHIAAAIALIVLSTNLYLYYNTSFFKSSDDFVQQDVAPGGNKAVLTLADGRTINLSDAENGNLAEQSGIAVTKNEDGMLTYTAGMAMGTQAISYNTIATPVGGQFQINLPDGTKVWLNAGSSLKFPVSFAKMNERKVELIGEAYFEVAHSKDLTFIVKSREQEVKVLGTHFNINSYPDETETRTTLLEGSVKVSLLNQDKAHKNGKPVQLIPGQQSRLHDGQLLIREVNVENAVAWKNGLLMFNDEPLGEVMRKISRWYAVDVVIKNEAVVEQGIYGTISKYSTLSEVLNMLELAGDMHFELKNNTVIVSKK